MTLCSPPAPFLNSPFGAEVCFYCYGGLFRVSALHFAAFASFFEFRRYMNLQS
jgi:hypothetical protein